MHEEMENEFQEDKKYIVTDNIIVITDLWNFSSNIGYAFSLLAYQCGIFRGKIIIIIIISNSLG